MRGVRAKCASAAAVTGSALVVVRFYYYGKKNTALRRLFFTAHLFEHCKYKAFFCICKKITPFFRFFFAPIYKSDSGAVAGGRCAAPRPVAERWRLSPFLASDHPTPPRASLVVAGAVPAVAIGSPPAHPRRLTPPAPLRASGRGQGVQTLARAHACRAGRVQSLAPSHIRSPSQGRRHSQGRTHLQRCGHS